MPTANLTLFLAASLALIIAPGPDSLYVLARGVGQGRRAGIISAFGTSTGLLVRTSAAALGVAALLQASTLAYTVMRLAGAAYLLYLGIRTLLSKQPFNLPEAGVRTSGARMYAQGALTNILNPKVALFFVAFLPQFADPRSGALAPQMLLLGVTFALMGLAYLVLVALISSALGRLLRAHPAWASRLRWFTGSVLIGLGVRLAISESR
jgi:threonine/homoserine/homoserine lactone efflux protein